MSQTPAGFRRIQVWDAPTRLFHCSLVILVVVAWLTGEGEGMGALVHRIAGEAIAGLIVAADIKGADANNAGLWLELDAILADVVGGNSLLGGRFSILGSLLGVVIIQAINTGILTSGFPPEYNLIIKAVIIVVILVIQSPRIGELSAFFRTSRAGQGNQQGNP